MVYMAQAISDNIKILGHCIVSICLHVCICLCVQSGTVSKCPVSLINHTECISTHDAVEGALHGVVEFHGVVLQDGGLVAGRDVLLGVPVGPVVPVQKTEGVLHVSQEAVLVELLILF